MGVSACKGFAYYSLKLVFLANGNRYEVDSNTSFFSKVLPCPNSDPFLKLIHICSLRFYVPIPTVSFCLPLLDKCTARAS